MRYFGIFAVAILWLTSTPAAGPAGSDWPSYGHDPGRSLNRTVLWGGFRNANLTRNALSFEVPAPSFERIVGYPDIGPKGDLGNVVRPSVQKGQR